MIEKKYANEDLEIELTLFIDDKQNVWFRGKDIAKILGYSNTRKAMWNHVDSDDKQQIFTQHTSVPKMGTGAPHASVRKMGPFAPNGIICTYINESGFYTLVLSSKLETAKKFKY